jgi:hypothetical protein
VIYEAAKNTLAFRKEVLHRFFPVGRCIDVFMSTSGGCKADQIRGSILKLSQMRVGHHGHHRAFFELPVL